MGTYEVEFPQDSSNPTVNIIPETPPIHSPPHPRPAAITTVVAERPNSTTTILLDKSCSASEILEMDSLPAIRTDYDGVSFSHPLSPNRTSYVGSRPQNLRPISPASILHPENQTGVATNGNTLAALSIGAPLIASVVISCLSVMRDEISARFGDDIPSRPFSAKATFALMWAATITGLGSTMIAVAGLAMEAGYHDSHVGVTKTIARRLRAWRMRRKSNHIGEEEHIREPSPARTVATALKKERHALAALRAAEVSARVSLKQYPQTSILIGPLQQLLGASITILAISLTVHIFTVYGWGVGVFDLIVGLVTAALCLLPVLSVIVPST
ncbi:hypothetical protein C8Q75DRAFT_744604 [Abortiporus biennis]|nr:hypothetical protein C8Q75DRAFT_744604 [Abortiporus biennis]